MNYQYEPREILTLFQNFYEITGLRSAIYDASLRWIARYPESGCRLCNLYAATEQGRACCLESDMCGLLQTAAQKKTYIFHCHAGLAEVCLPVIIDDTVAAYIIFGQLRIEGAHATDDEVIFARCREYVNDDDQLREMISELRSLDASYVEAAASIMRNCISHILLERYVRVYTDNAWELIERYVNDHLDKPINATGISRDLGMSPSTIYHKTKLITNNSFSEYVARQKAERAKWLLVTTDLSIGDVSYALGYEDYNYFIRVFRKVTGVSPGKYRSMHRLAPAQDSVSLR